MCTCKQQCQCKEKKIPHVHAEVIKAWADGAEIESQHRAGGEWVQTTRPGWLPEYNYRIKPEPKPDKVYYLLDLEGISTHLLKYRERDLTPMEKESYSMVKVVVDGETGKLKSVEMVQ